jgi:hypothetical protein
MTQDGIHVDLPAIWRTIEALRGDLIRADEQCELLLKQVTELQQENARLRAELTKDTP